MNARAPLHVAESGQALVEYIVAVGVFALPIAMVLLELGRPLLRLFRYGQLALGSPFP